MSDDDKPDLALIDFQAIRRQKATQLMKKRYALGIQMECLLRELAACSGRVAELAPHIESEQLRQLNIALSRLKSGWGDLVDAYSAVVRDGDDAA